MKRTSLLAAAGSAAALLATSFPWFPARAASHSPTSAPGATSLPAVASGARPGPDVLYADPPAAPQLENRDARFRAAPLLVSGTDAYVSGEYVYQDYIWDDHGANTDGSAGGPGTYAGDAAYPAEHPVNPEDLAATIFDALGIDPHGCINDREGRPVALVDGGRPLRELFA